MADNEGAASDSMSSDSYSAGDVPAACPCCFGVALDDGECPTCFYSAEYELAPLSWLAATILQCAAVCSVAQNPDNKPADVDYRSVAARREIAAFFEQNLELQGVPTRGAPPVTKSIAVITDWGACGNLTAINTRMVFISRHVISEDMLLREEAVDVNVDDFRVRLVPWGDVPGLDASVMAVKEVHDDKGFLSGQELKDYVDTNGVCWEVTGEVGEFFGTFESGDILEHGQSGRAVSIDNQCGILFGHALGEPLVGVVAMDTTLRSIGASISVRDQAPECIGIILSPVIDTSAAVQDLLFRRSEFGAAGDALAVARSLQTARSNMPLVEPLADKKWLPLWRSLSMDEPETVGDGGPSLITIESASTISFGEFYEVQTKYRTSPDDNAGHAEEQWYNNVAAKINYMVSPTEYGTMRTALAAAREGTGMDDEGAGSSSLKKKGKKGKKGTKNKETPWKNKKKKKKKKKKKTKNKKSIASAGDNTDAVAEWAEIKEAILNQVFGTDNGPIMYFKFTSCTETSTRRGHNCHVRLASVAKKLGVNISYYAREIFDGEDWLKALFGDWVADERLVVRGGKLVFNNGRDNIADEASDDDVYVYPYQIYLGSGGVQRGGYLWSTSEDQITSAWQTLNP